MKLICSIFEERRLNDHNDGPISAQDCRAGGRSTLFTLDIIKHKMHIKLYRVFFFSLPPPTISATKIKPPSSQSEPFFVAKTKQNESFNQSIMKGYEKG